MEKFPGVTIRTLSGRTFEAPDEEDDQWSTALEIAEEFAGDRPDEEDDQWLMALEIAEEFAGARS